ncbi:MAG: RNA methyltransferase [Planctomycetota bacterium]
MNILLEDYRSIGPRPSAKRDAREEFFIVEGPRIIRRLIACGYSVRSIVVQRGKPRDPLGEVPNSIPFIEQTRDEIGELVGFDFHRGYLASAHRKPLKSVMDLEPDPLMLGLVGVTDMENMGSLIRSAAAFGVRQVVLDRASVDPLGRRVCRVSMGASLAMSYGLMDSPVDTLIQLHERGIDSLAATPHGDASLVENVSSLTKPSLLLLGNESDGLPQPVLQTASKQVRIPMPGRASHEIVDSLNVAVAGAILMHAMCRSLDRPRK